MTSGQVTPNWPHSDSGIIVIWLEVYELYIVRLLVEIMHCSICIFSYVYGDHEFNLHSIQCVMKVCDVGIHSLYFKGNILGMYFLVCSLFKQG